MIAKMNETTSSRFPNLLKGIYIQIAGGFNEFLNILENCSEWQGLKWKISTGWTYFIIYGLLIKMDSLSKNVNLSVFCKYTNLAHTGMIPLWKMSSPQEISSDSSLTNWQLSPWWGKAERENASNHPSCLTHVESHIRNTPHMYREKSWTGCTFTGCILHGLDAYSL